MDGGLARRMAQDSVDPTEVEARLRREALASYHDVYRDLAENWRHLDSKAQGTTAIAGVFLAGALALINTLPEDALDSTKIAYTASVVLLTASIALSVWALMIRDYFDVAPWGDSLHKVVEELIDSGEHADPDVLRRHVGTQRKMWSEAVEKIAQINSDKAMTLKWAQGVVFAAVFVACAGILYKVW